MLTASPPLFRVKPLVDLSLEPLDHGRLIGIGVRDRVSGLGDQTTSMFRICADITTCQENGCAAMSPGLAGGLPALARGGERDGAGMDDFDRGDFAFAGFPEPAIAQRADKIAGLGVIDAAAKGCDPVSQVHRRAQPGSWSSKDGVEKTRFCLTPARFDRVNREDHRPSPRPPGAAFGCGIRCYTHRFQQLAGPRGRGAIAPVIACLGY